MEIKVKYMLLIYMNEQAMNDVEREQCYKDSTQIAVDLSAKGQFVAASPLHSVTSATSVRVRDGKSLVTDGPFAETREQLGGFYIIEVKNLDEAIAVAGKLSPAKKGTVEIRPIMELSGLPQN